MCKGLSSHASGKTQTGLKRLANRVAGGFYPPAPAPPSVLYHIIFYMGVKSSVDLSIENGDIRFL